MKSTLLLLLILCLSFLSFSQEMAPQPNITAKWAPSGLLLGNASLQAEYNFGGRNSLTAKIGLPVNVKHILRYDGNDAAFNMKATSFLAGYRTYFSRSKHLRGLYYEPFFKYVHHVSEGRSTGTLNNRAATFSFMNNYNGVGVGVQLGTQFFIGKRIVVDLFFIGPELNSASNSFKATEVSSANPWSYMEAKDAERTIREFIDQFPFIGNRTTVMVNKDNKRVNADFRGALPGLRTGVAIGFAF